MGKRRFDRRFLLMLVVVLLLQVGCQASGSVDVWKEEWAWGVRESHRALVDGAWVRDRWIRNLDPQVRETYVGAEWMSGHATTEADFLPLLRPVTDGPGALAVLELTAKARVQGGEFTHLRTSYPLAHDTDIDEAAGLNERYGTSEAARWGIPTHPEIEVREQVVIVRRVVWRGLRPGEEEASGEMPPHGEWLSTMQAGVVEWVADTVERSGRVRREVLRVLLEGPEARRYGPLPLM